MWQDVAGCGRKGGSTSLSWPEWTFALIKQICLPTLRLMAHVLDMRQFCVYFSQPTRPRPAKQRERGSPLGKELWQLGKGQTRSRFSILIGHQQALTP